VRTLVADALAGKPTVAVEDIGQSSALDYGGIAVLKEAWERFELERLFEAVPSARHRALLRAMIFGRVLFPSSKLGLSEEGRGTWLAAACGLSQTDETFDEDDLYEAMDQMAGRWVSMEKKLYQMAFPEGVRLVLYDLTSIYFEGKGPEKTAQYGYSRDHRSDRRQVLLAVATDGDGVPIHLEMLRGNRGDTTTLLGLLTTLRRRFGITEAVFVFDGGMSSRINLEQMEAEQLKYVTCLSSAALAALVSELPSEVQPSLWDRTQLMDVVHEGKRYVIAGGVFRKHRDEERRQTRIAKAEAALAKLAKVPRKRPNIQKLVSTAGRLLERFSAHKYFEYGVKDNGVLYYRVKKEKMREEAALDGLYLLRTNLASEQVDEKKVLGHYKNLMAVENAFCQLKSYMEVRPVYHYRSDRVRNHVRICFLAYWLTARIGQEWRSAGELGEVPNLLRQLQVIRVGMLTVKGCPLKAVMSQVPKEINVLLKKLKLLHLFSELPIWVTCSPTK
jgi:transposase